MSTLSARWRARRDAARRARAINRALAHATSPAHRDELLTIANRD